jgi:hypothetical protein
MRISSTQRIQNENRIRAAMDRLLRGEIPPGGNCDIKTLASQAGVDRTAFYGNRPYAHLRTEFEDRLRQLQDCGQTPDPKAAQIQRLNTEVDKLRHRLAQANTTIGELTDFRTRALARLAAQHEEIQRLRTVADPNVNVTRLPRARQKIIGPC